jgi:uncharacterized protein involved in exopolysaccharide biosynthesis
MDFKTLDRSIESGLAKSLLAIWRHKFIFGLVTFMSFAAIVLGTLAIEPRYEASTLLIAGQNIIENQDPQKPGTITTPATQLTLIQVAQSDDVIRRAIEVVGLANLVDLDVNPAGMSVFARLRSLIFVSKIQPQSPTLLEVWLPRIKLAIDVKSEPNSNIIHISYRNKDPVVAEQFVNAVAQSFIDRQIVLYARPGVVDFFRTQKQRFDADAKSASLALDQFSISTSIYSIENQRELLLGRVSDLNSTIAFTRASIVKQAAERQTLGDQLRQLAPVARSPWVSSLVANLAGAPSAANSNVPPINDPPLLLVKVYQDSMVSLFKMNSDLSGLEKTLTQQTSELANLTDNLNAITRNEQRFVQLNREVDQASYNSDTYAKRLVEEEINAASSTAKLSSIKIMQVASIPIRPVFPNYIMVFLAATIASTLAGLGAANLRINRRRPAR